MNEVLRIRRSYAFNNLDFDKVIYLRDKFAEKELLDKDIRQTVTITQRDIVKDVSDADARTIFTTLKFDRIHIAVGERLGVSSNCLNIFIERKPNRVSILLDHLNPAQGKKIIADFVDFLHLKDVYDNRLLLVADNGERSYIEEALICRNSGALRSAVIMMWTFVMHRIYNKIHNNFKIQFITEIKKKHQNDKKFILKKINNLEDYQQFKDKEVLDLIENLYMSKGFSRQLKYFLDVRNNCAHVREWKPTESSVDAFFDA